jgi:hypothetical protein
MQQDHEHYHREPRPGWWKSRAGLVTLFFLAAAGYFLITEHQAHVVPILPWLILLLCPLMHFFHHRGHGHSHRNDHMSERK